MSMDTSIRTLFRFKESTHSEQLTKLILATLTLPHLPRTKTSFHKRHFKSDINSSRAYAGYICLACSCRNLECF